MHIITVQATMNLLVESVPKYAMAPGFEAPIVQQQLLNFCKACTKGKLLNNYWPNQSRGSS